MQQLPIGLPKIMVSSMAAGDVSAYVGASDINMLYSVTDLAGLNRISRRVLGNAARQIAGAVRFAAIDYPDDKPAIGLTMFGVTTPCIQALVADLEPQWDCLTFHATGSGGRALEKLIDSRQLHGAIDLTTTEVADYLFGGVLPCNADRFGAIARTGIPCVLSCGAIDMINFGAPNTVPARYANRLRHHHNPQVTLVRTSARESALIGRWIGEKINACTGEVRFVIPAGGVSALDAPGQPFWDPAALAAFTQALEETVYATDKRRLIKRLIILTTRALHRPLPNSSGTLSAGNDYHSLQNLPVITPSKDHLLRRWLYDAPKRGHFRVNPATTPSAVRSLGPSYPDASRIA